MEGDSQRMEVLAWRDVDSKREETALESRGKLWRAEGLVQEAD